MKFMKCFRIHIPFYFSEKTLVYQVNTIHKFLCSVELHCGAMIHSLNLLVADFSLDAMCGLSSVHGSSRRRRRRRRVHGRCRPVIGRVHWIDGSGSRSYNKREEESDIERKDDTTEASYQKIFQTSSRTSLQASQKMPLALLLLETRMKVILATRCTAEEEEEEASSAGEAFVPQAACCTALRDSKPRSSQLHRQCRQLVFFSSLRRSSLCACSFVTFKSGSFDSLLLQPLGHLHSDHLLLRQLSSVLLLLFLLDRLGFLVDLRANLFQLHFLFGAADDHVGKNRSVA